MNDDEPRPTGQSFSFDISTTVVGVNLATIQLNFDGELFDTYELDMLVVYVREG